MYFNFDFTTLSGTTGYNFNFESIVTYFSVLYDNYYTSIWCDPNASINSGNIYLGRTNELLVVKIENKIPRLVDHYTTTISGSINEALTAEDIVDINIVM